MTDEHETARYTIRKEPPLTRDPREYQIGGDHYKDMSIQPWDALKAWMTLEEYRGYHKATVIDYVAREVSKGGLTDLRKARHHLDELICTLEALGEE